MNYIKNERFLNPGLVAFAFAMLAAPPVLASGSDMTRMGGERGHAAGPTPLATYYNPAALSGTEDLHFAVDLTLVLHSAEYERSAASTVAPAGAQGANVGTANLFDVMVAPTLAASIRLGDAVIGLGFFAPMSGAESWNTNDEFEGDGQFPGAVDSVARWHVIEGDQTMLYSSLAASYSFPKLRLSIGAGANLIYSQLRLLRASTPRGDDDLGAEGRIDLDVTALTGSFSAGLLWEAVPEHLWLGLSYQAPPGLNGDLTMTGEMRTFITTDETEAVALQQSMPDVVRWAARYRRDNYELRLFGDYTRWSTLTKQCLYAEGSSCDVEADGSATAEARIISNQPRKWQDAFAVRAGFSLFPTKTLELFTGVGYDSSAIPTQYLEATYIDGHEISGALGARVKLGDNIAWTLSYTHIHTLNRTVTGSRLDRLQAPSKLPTGNGKYSQWLGMVDSFVELYFE